MVTQIELGRRLRLAREACGLTQEAVAIGLKVNRSAVSQLESGERAVSSLELNKLAFLYGRTMGEFFSDKFEGKDSLLAFFRAHSDFIENEEVMNSLRKCASLAHEQRNLENLLEIDRHKKTIASYSSPAPIKKWAAIEQGEDVAKEERRRLGLGIAPIEDVAKLLDGEGIGVSQIKLLDKVSGFTLNAQELGPLIVINTTHPASRQRYSYAHEYAHVLFDRSMPSIVSREDERNNMLEVRANAFTAGFLMPEMGIRHHLALLGKDERASRMQAELFDEKYTTTIEVRGSVKERNIQIYDVAQIAHVFGVSKIALIYRLRNLRLINDVQQEQLISDDRASGLAISTALKLSEPAKPVGNYFLPRFLGLALEALRREEISQAKFFELARHAGLEKPQAKNLAKSAGLDSC